MTSRLIAAVPQLASLDIEKSLAFFERLRFTRLHASREYGVARRDSVSIHNDGNLVTFNEAAS